MRAARRCRFSRGEGEGAALADGDAALAPEAALAHDLPDGKGVDELVGDEDERAVRHVLDRSVPLQRDRAIAQRLVLDAAEHGACLDQSYGDAVEKLGHASPGAERVSHQGAASRPKLGDDHRGGLAHGLPDGGGPDTDQLAEDLADLRSGDEIAFAPDRLTRGVIAAALIGEAGFHIVVNADRPFAGNPLSERCRERSGIDSVGLPLRAHHDDAKASCCRARQISQSPIAIMGME